jgi:hypothetical protein
MTTPVQNDVEARRVANFATAGSLDAAAIFLISTATRYAPLWVALRLSDMQKELRAIAARLMSPAADSPPQSIEITEAGVEALRDEQLKPCPFCGVLPSITPADEGADVVQPCVGCINVLCEVQPEVIDDTEARARERWNSRAE